MKSVLSILIVFCASLFPQKSGAQELMAKIVVNTQKVGMTDKSVFDNLQQTLEQFIDDRQWTELHFLLRNIYKNRKEYWDSIKTVLFFPYKIALTIYIIKSTHAEAKIITTTLYNNKDANFNFEFAEFDQLNFNDETVDNQLTALIAYYAYLIIGLDLDSFAPLGGTDVLQRCYNLVNNAQNLNFPGWKAFDDSRNRFAIINDYMEEPMKPFRQLQYDYYRRGLDEMANNVERGRTQITEALVNGLKKAHDNRPLSLLPQIWTDYKRDELTSIYKGKGTQKEKEQVYDLLMTLNASQGDSWEKVRN